MTLIDIARPFKDIWDPEFMETFTSITKVSVRKFTKEAQYQHRRNTKVWTGHEYELRQTPMRITLKKL